MECPNCGKYVEAKTGFFARKKIDCTCGYTIDVRTDKLTSRTCAHCGNDVVFDQSKGNDAKCPVCGEPINAMSDKDKTVQFSCAQCGIRLNTAKGATTYICPVCDHVNDVVERLKTEEIKKDGLASIIKYEGDADTLVWKHPIEDFNLGSQLIVHESQEAIFFRDGQALDLFSAGRYTLETQQLPILEKLYSLPTDTEGTFHSEVYFFNLVSQMAIKWGTPEKINFLEPMTGAPISIGARGVLNFKIANARKLLLKLAELEAKKQLDIRIQENVAEVEIAHRKAVAQKGETSVLEAQYASQRKVAEATGDVQAKRLHMQLEMERKAQMAQIEAEEMRLKGYNQKDVMQAAVQKAYAGALGQMGANGGGSGSGMLSDIAGLSVTLGAMGSVIGMTKDAMAPMMNIGAAMAAPAAPAAAGGWDCACGAKNIQSKFCPECGHKKT